MELVYDVGEGGVKEEREGYARMPMHFWKKRLRKKRGSEVGGTFRDLNGRGFRDSGGRTGCGISRRRSAGVRDED